MFAKGRWIQLQTLSFNAVSMNLQLMICEIDGKLLIQNQFAVITFALCWLCLRKQFNVGLTVYLLMKVCTPCLEIYFPPYQHRGLYHISHASDFIHGVSKGLVFLERQISHDFIVYSRSYENYFYQNEFYAC